MAVSTSRSRISEILGTDSKPKVSSTPETGSRVAQILGVDTPEAAQQALYRPAVGPTTYDWVEEGYIDSATPGWQKALASGPVGGFFNVIQKPLSLGSSLAKESIDLATGQGFSFNDLRQQYNDNYTFGRLLHDYDILQNRDSGWQKFGAASLGFLGDVALDPLSYLGMVGKGAAFTAKLATGGARGISRKAVAENLKKVTLGAITRSAGDDVARGLGDNAFLELGDRLARGEAGRFGQMQLRQGKAGGWELDVFAKIGDDAAEEVVVSTTKIGKSISDEITDFFEISSKAAQRGASFIDGDEMRRAANFVAQSGIDKAGRSSADNVAAAVERSVNRAVRELGEDATDDVIRETIERVTREATEEASAAHRAFLTADEAVKMKLGIGLKVPGTGPIGRALRIADPITNAINKVTRAGVQAPVGIRFMTSETPIIGKLAMSLPRGVRGAVNRAGVSKVGNALVGGRLQDLKRTLRSTNDAVLIQQGKRVIHSVARGNSKGKYAKTQMLQKLRLITEAIEDAGADPAMVYHAVGGDEAAARELAVLDNSLLNTVQEGIEDLRVMANEMGGSEFLSSVDNYVPRQLTDEAREAIQESLAASGRYSQRTHRGRGKYQPTGPELRRSYLDQKAFREAAEAKAAADGISVKEAGDLLKQSGEATDEFFGETLLTPKSVDPLTGEVAGSVEKQIADIIERNGGDYALFVDDINIALRGWVDQVAPRVGETYTQTLLTESGILQHRFVEYVRLPSAEAKAASVKLLKAEEDFAARQAGVIRAAYEVQSAVGAQLDVAKMTLRRQEELAEEAQRALDIARREEDELFASKSVEEQRVLSLDQQERELQSVLDQVEGRLPETEGDELVRLEAQRQDLLKQLNLIRGDQGRFRWAYDTIASATGQKLWLEKAIREIFGSGENFTAFSREFSNADVSDPSFDITQTFVAPDGTEIVVQDAVGFADGILERVDAEGYGLWMGVERDIDLVNLKVAANNPFNKIDYMRNRINDELQSALDVANGYKEATGDEVLLPTPQNTLEAQQELIAVVDDAIEAGQPTTGGSLGVVFEGMEDELAVYYAVNEFPTIGPAAASEADWKAITTQIEEKIGGRIQDLAAEIELRGSQLNLSYTDRVGREQTLTVADYVFLKQRLNAIETAKATHQFNLRHVRPGIDEMRLVEGPSGTNPGGVYEDQAGNRYYAKQYNEVEEDFYGEPTAMYDEDGDVIASPRRAAGEVLANAFYRELGLGAPNSYMSIGNDGSTWHVAPMIQDFATVQSTFMDPAELLVWTDPVTGLQRLGNQGAVPQGVVARPFQEIAEEGYMADVVLANWDAAGTGYDNVGIAPYHLEETSVVRIDNGGVFGYRAQGLPKEETGWSYRSLSELEDLANPSMNPFAAGMIGDYGGMDTASQQIEKILALRARYNGFEDFVRRHAGELDNDDIAYFADFLEVRTQALAEQFNKPFHEAGSEELMKAGLASRGYSPTAVENAFSGVTSAEIASGVTPDGVATLNHGSSGGGVQNVWGGYGDLQSGWGDYWALNATPGNIKYGLAGGDTYNLELDVPMGGQSVKIYGLDSKQQDLAAQLAVQMAVETDPEKVTSIAMRLNSLVELGRGTEAIRPGLTSENAFVVDQVARVMNSDREFLVQYIDQLEEASKTISYVEASDTGFTRTDAGILQTNVFEPLRLALALSNFNPPNVSPAYEQIVGQLNRLQGEDLVEFAVVMSRKHGGVDQLEDVDGFLNKALEYFSEINPDLNPDVIEEGKLVAGVSFEKKKNFNYVANFATGFDSLVHKGSLFPRVDVPTGSKIVPTAMETVEDVVIGDPLEATLGRMYVDFISKYTTSLSVDGYTSVAWMNHEAFNDVIGAYDGAKQGTKFWPNFLVTDPLAINYKGGRFIDSGDVGPLDIDYEQTSDFVGATKFLEDQAKNINENFPSLYPIVNDLPEGDALEEIVMQRSQIVSDLELAKGDFEQADAAFKAARERTVAAAETADQRLAEAETTRVITGYLDANAVQVDEAVETLNRLGVGEGVSLYDIADDDLIAMKLATNILIEADGQRIRMALEEMEDGADGWFDLLSSTAEQRTEIHRIGNREEVLEAAFSTGMKPIGAIAQGPPNIVESMTAAERFVARGGAKGFFRKYDKLHNLLRAYMIAKPGFHGRNFMSGVFMNHLAGMNWSSYRRFMRAYWKFQEEEAMRLGMPDRASKMRKAMRARGINPNNVSAEHVDYVRELAETGALGAAGAQVASEFVDTATAAGSRKGVKIAGKKVNLLKAMNPASSENLPLRLSRNFGMATETFLRGSLGFDALYKGGSADEAFDNVMKFHFDYDDLSDLERNVIKKVVPFYTWTRKNMPLMFEMAARRPVVFNRYMSFKKEMEYGQERAKVIPEWMQRQGAIQTPFKYDGENMFILPDMPFKAPMELLEPSLRFTTEDSVMDRIQIALGSFGTQVTPLIKAPYEWKAKQNLWKGYNFDGKYEVVPRAYAKVPFLMELLSLPGIAGKNNQGQWAMKDYELHAMAQLMPTLSDLRRLFPDEERYQKRAVSTWISFMFGAGLRTNTKWEQQMELQSRMYEMRDEIKQERSLAGARL